MKAKELQALLQDQQVDKRLQAVNAFPGLDAVEQQLFVLALGDADWRVRKEAISYFLRQPNASSYTNLLLEQLGHPENAGLRNAAIEILVSLGAQVTEDLLAHLFTADAEVRKFLVDIIGEIGCSDCAPKLLACLQDNDENVRYAVVETLGKLRSVEAVEALLELLEQADAGLKFTIFEALTAIGKGVPVARIVPYAENTLLRKSVFNCLGQLADVAAIPVLLQGLSDPLRKNREIALLAFGQLIESLPVKDCPEVDPQSDQVIDQLLVYLRHDNAAFRRSACYVLSLFPSAAVVKEILPLLAEEELRADVVAAAKLIPRTIFISLLADMRISDANALYLIFLCGELDYPEVELLALNALESDDPQFRFVAITALGKISSEQAIDLIGDALADTVVEIREAAASALSHIGRCQPEAIGKTVRPFLESNAAELRLLAVRIIGNLPIDTVENDLLLALKDVDSDVRCEALQALRGHESQRLLSGLSLALTDEVPAVRRLATAAVGAFPAQRAIPILQHALDDPDPWVRMEAIRAFDRQNEEALRSALARGFADPVGLVVIAALESAHRLLTEEADDCLRQGLTHEDPDVVNTAVRLLAATGAISELLTHERPLVRRQAVAELGRSENPQRLRLLENCLKTEKDLQVRQTVEDMLRKG